MAEELKELLEKIQREGVDAAEEKKRQIESDAKRHAGKIIDDARKEAIRIVAEAKEQVSSMESSGRESLKQAARDTLISLRKDIVSTLDKIIRGHVHKALGSDELAGIILTLIKESAGSREDKIIAMRKEDQEKVEKVLLGELGDELKKGIVLKHAAEIKGGFTISYDGGKSFYDFTDKSLAEYLAAYLNTRLGRILEEAAPKVK